jgi:two-component system sensor histidine kinase DesK
MVDRLFGIGDGGAEFNAATARRRRTVGLTIGLVYLFPLAKVVGDYSGAKLVLAAIGLAALIATYLGSALSRGTWKDPVPWYTWVWLAVFTMLVIVLPMVFGQEWIGLPIYIGVVYALTLPYRWAPWGVVAGALLACVQALLLGSPAGGVANLTISTFAIGLMMVAFRHARMLVHQLHEARGEVARLAATEERLRIARDLHDLLGHSLSLIVLKSELARRLAERDPAVVAREVGDIESVARQALADVREAVSGYRQRTLTDELDSARAVLGTAGVEAAVRMSGGPLPDQLDGLFGWAVREAVTNVVRHARATRCEITLTYDGSRAELRVEDNGRGAEAYVPGNGLSGLTERIEHAGGSIEAGPLPAGGFRLAAQLRRAPSPHPEPAP